jgi:D-aspartate ligase
MLTNVPEIRPHTVIITGADTPTGLTTARALKGMGLSLVGVAADPQAPCCLSNIWDQIIPVTLDPEVQAQELLALGRSLVDEIGVKPLLLFSQDSMVIEASRLQTSFEACFNFVLPARSAMSRLMDKTLFHLWAEEQGYRVPKSKIVASYDQLEEYLDEYTFPCILKPLVRTPDWDHFNSNDKFVYLNQKQDIRDYRHYQKLFAMVDRYVLQEWIPGGDEQVFFCLFSVDANGHVLDGFSGRKLLQWPLLGGSTAVCIDWPDPELLSMSQEILLAAGLRGLGSIEYKRHAETGHYYITEPTVGRNDYQSFVAVEAGHNMTRALISSMLGLDAATSPPQTPVIWIDEISSIRALRKRGLRSGELRKMLHLLWVRRRVLLIARIFDLQPFLKLVGRLIYRFAQNKKRR